MIKNKVINIKEIMFCDTEVFYNLNLVRDLN